MENQDAIDYVVQKYFSVAPKVSNNQPYGDRIYTPEWVKSADEKIKLRPNYPRIPEGCRNICLTSLAGMLHNLGYTRQQILDELIYCNKVACKPMLYERELHTIANSVTRYKR